MRQTRPVQLERLVWRQSDKCAKREKEEKRAFGRLSWVITRVRSHASSEKMSWRLFATIAFCLKKNYTNKETHGEVVTKEKEIQPDVHLAIVPTWRFEIFSEWNIIRRGIIAFDIYCKLFFSEGVFLPEIPQNNLFWTYGIHPLPSAEVESRVRQYPLLRFIKTE